MNEKTETGRGKYTKNGKQVINKLQFKINNLTKV